MVEIINLVKTYEMDGKVTQALKGVSLHIAKGEIYGIIGTSGAGKSSLMRCINMLEKPTSGEIIVDGINISTISKKELRNHRKKIGMVFQHFNLLMNSTVYENIAFPLKLNKKPKDYIDKKVNELLALVGLEDKKDMYPANLSGGQKQRVGIARAIACEPSIIMCDEATSALDPDTTKSILKLLKTINQKLNISIIIITHEMEVIKEICHKVAILEEGHIVEQGNVLDIFINPKTGIAKRFFDTIDIKIDNSIYRNALKSGGIFIKAIFKGNTATEPFISKIISSYGVEVAILLGNIQSMNDTLIGSLIIRINGEEDSIKKSIESLRESGVFVEVIQDV